MVAERRARRQQAVQVVDVRNSAQPHPAADAERAERAARIAASVAARYAQATRFSESIDAGQDLSAADAADTDAAISAASNSLLSAPVPGQHTNFAPYTHGDAAQNFLAESAAVPPPPADNFDFQEQSATVPADAFMAPAAAAPVVEDVFATSLVAPQQPLPANLIHFPREFVAARRARPRLTDRARAATEPDTENGSSLQLRIFEVDAPAAPYAPAIPQPPAAAQPVASPATVSEPDPICLDAPYMQPSTLPAEDFIAAQTDLPLPVAAASVRAMAFAVDFAVVTGAFFAFLFVFALTSPQLPTGKLAILICAGVYAALWLLYQGMFFSLSDATAGMRYARIAFCTMDDSNPTRAMLLRRIPAWWVSALPLGLGLLWAAFDEDGLCWHDRISSTYLREY